MAILPTEAEAGEIGDRLANRYRSLGWQEREEKIVQVLARHLPTNDEADFARIASNVEQAWDWSTHSRSQQSLVRSLNAEWKSLIGARNALSSAIKHFSAVGVYGEDVLESAYLNLNGAAISHESQSLPPSASPSALDGPQQIICNLIRTRHQVQEALSLLDVSMKLQGLGSRYGRRPELVGLAVTAALSLPYERLTGRKAAVATQDGTAYGPFLELINDVFKCLGMTASPEGRIRGQSPADKEKTPRK